MPDAEGGTANLFGLVVEAIRAGGISTPPVPFDPGWRFILVVITAVFANGAAALAVANRRPRLAVFIPLPLLFGAAFVQPADAPVAMTVIALMLVPAALTVAHGGRCSPRAARSLGDSAAPPGSSRRRASPAARPSGLSPAPMRRGSPRRRARSMSPSCATTSRSP
ncbi:MAG: hypothetical protein KY463_15890, partial [Actinobacteria bacterium]|nr:hypothetical protein [Actinomycetota bacterium]